MQTLELHVIIADATPADRETVEAAVEDIVHRRNMDLLGMTCDAWEMGERAWPPDVIEQEIKELELIDLEGEL